MTILFSRENLGAVSDVRAAVLALLILISFDRSLIGEFSLFKIFFSVIFSSTVSDVSVGFNPEKRL